MINLFRLLTLILVLTFLYACETKKETGHKADNLIQQDSIAIVDLFNQALIQPAQADSLIRSGEAFSKKNDILEETFLFNLSRFYIQTGKLSYADSVIDGVINRYNNREDNYAVGKFYNLKAAVAAYQHQQEQSVQYYQQAIAIFEKYQDQRQLAVIQFNLANIFFSRLDYPSVHKYITEAKANFEAIGDSVYMPVADGILAVSLTKLEEAEQSKSIAENALQASTKAKNPLGEIVAHYALGEYYHHKQQFDNALQHYKEAERLGQQFQVPTLNLPLKAAMLTAYNHLGSYQEAVAVGREALAIAGALNNVEIQYNLNKNLAEAFMHTGEEREAYQHLKTAEEIFRNNTLANNQKTLQKLLIEYETEKKNVRILQQDNAIAKQQTYIVLLATLTVLAVVIFINYRRNARQRRKIDQHNKAQEITLALTQGEEKERVRLANELHDGIASNLIAIKLQLETSYDNNQKSEHISLVKKTHQEVRKIAQNLMPVNFEKEDWQDVLALFCRDISNGRPQVKFVKSTEHIQLPQDHALILYRCIQELIQNAVKHADSNHIIVQVLKDQSGLRITVEDDGCGFDVEEARRKGIALFKYEDRLQQIGATFDVDSRIGKGTTTFINYNGQ